MGLGRLWLIRNAVRTWLRLLVTSFCMLWFWSHPIITTSWGLIGITVLVLFNHSTRSIWVYLVVVKDSISIKFPAFPTITFTFVEICPWIRRERCHVRKIFCYKWLVIFIWDFASCIEDRGSLSRKRGVEDLISSSTFASLFAHRNILDVEVSSDVCYPVLHLKDLNFWVFIWFKVCWFNFLM